MYKRAKWSFLHSERCGIRSAIRSISTGRLRFISCCLKYHWNNIRHKTSDTIMEWGRCVDGASCGREAEIPYIGLTGQLPGLTVGCSYRYRPNYRSTHTCYIAERRGVLNHRQFDYLHNNLFRLRWINSSPNHTHPLHAKASYGIEGLAPRYS